MASLTKPLVLGALVFGLLVVASPALLRSVPDFGEAVSASAGSGQVEQSGSQLSEGEYEQIASGTTPAQLRAFAGEPAERSSVEIEGIELECWYYGVVGRTGAYQLCFENGSLTSKLRFARR